jgi:hypothetical protein
MRRFVFTVLFAALAAVCGLAGMAPRSAAPAEPPDVPAVYANITVAADGQLVFQPQGGNAFALRERAPEWTLAQVRGNAAGTATGLALDFKKRGFTGTLVYGLVPYHDTRHPQVVFRRSVPIKDGTVAVDIKGPLSGISDTVGWQQIGRGVIGFRVISAEGAMVYDGRVRFRGVGPFEPDVTLVEGPFVANVTPTGAVVWFELDRAASCSVLVGTRTFACKEGATRQEVAIEGLAPGTEHPYTVRYGDNEERYGFTTAPKPGMRRPFTFAYASDSRGGLGGGDRNFNGPNAHIMRPLMALALSRHAAFVQFTGDLISGPVTTADGLDVQYSNWKHTVEPWAHWFPFYAGVGNHEAVLREFADSTNRTVRVDRFPFDTESTEATFARHLVNPTNGPESEDESAYDPSAATTDFPSYRENVYSYTYDNVAVIVLNSNYWYAPSIAPTPQSGGNLHGYLMDNQVAWLAKVLDALERNVAIDHVFLTIHTPIFPNGGHSGDDMWYSGHNDPRPTIAGKPVAKGIIERRDDILALIQKNPKVLAALTGDEHNYNRLQLGPGVPIYPGGWDKTRVTLKRTFFQINNGAAGAPYYAQEKLPWSAHVSGFSTQHAVCLIIVEGKRVRLEVVNPETLETFDKAVLR